MIRPLKCRFFIPLHGDEAISSGERHSDLAWEWLAREIMVRYENSPVINDGSTPFPPYENWDAAGPPHPTHRTFSIELTHDEVPDLRALLADCCVVFDRKSLVLEVAGESEVVRHPDLPTET